MGDRFYAKTVGRGHKRSKIFENLPEIRAFMDGR